jgi:hypothetical protein
MSEIALPNLLLISVFAGLQELDGLQLKDSFTPFKFDDETTWRIADNTEAVRRALASYSTAKKLLAKQHQIQEGMKITEQNSANVAAFLEGVDALDAREVPVPGLTKIPRAALATPKNQIKPSTLAKLAGVLE